MAIELWIAIFVAIVGSGAMSTVVASVAQRRRNSAETDHTVVDAAMSIVNPLREELEKLREEFELEEAACQEQINALKKQTEQNCQELIALRRGVNILSNQVEALGHDPLWP